jgi:hypothetical protein
LLVTMPGMSFDLPESNAVAPSIEYRKDLARQLSFRARSTAYLKSLALIGDPLE